MKKKAKRAIEIQESIRLILWNDWDPIRVNNSFPDDEYNSYVGGIYRLLASGASEYQIVERLYQLETVSMGLSALGDERERLKKVAQKLLELNVSL